MGQRYGFDPNYGGNAEHFHYGLDYLCIDGMLVVAPVSGRVILSDDHLPVSFPDALPGAWGDYIEIEPDAGGPNVGLAHLLKRFVQMDEHVTAREAIGLSGRSGFTFGPHVHVQLVNRAGRTARERRPDPTSYFVSEATV